MRQRGQAQRLGRPPRATAQARVSTVPLAKPATTEGLESTITCITGLMASSIIRQNGVIWSGVFPHERVARP